MSIDHKIQYANGEAFVCEEHTDAKQPSVKLDMTTLYKDQASSVFRTFKLLNDYTIEITDEVDLLSPQSIVSWIASTKAQVEVKENRVRLTHEGKHFIWKSSLRQELPLKLIRQRIPIRVNIPLKVTICWRQNVDWKVVKERLWCV